MTKASVPRRKGQRAKLPPAGAITSRIDPTGLIYTAKNEDGTKEHEISLKDAPGPIALRQELIKCIAAMNGPNGSWKSLRTVETAGRITRHALAWSATSGLLTLDDLTPQLWAEWVAWIRENKANASGKTRNATIGSLRTVVRAHDGLSKQTREALNSRYYESFVEGEREFYSLDDYKALKKTSLRALRQAHKRITENWALAHTPYEQVPDSDKERHEALALLAAGKPLTRNSQYRAIGAWDPKHYNRLLREAASAFHLTTGEALAAAVAIVCETGENLSVVMNRKVPTTQGTAGDESVVIVESETDKPRRGPGKRFANEKATASKGRGKVLLMIAECTEPARIIAKTKTGTEPTELIVYTNSLGRFSSDLTIAAMRIQKTEAEWLPAGVTVNFQTLHRTVLTRVLGKATFNTPDTFIKDYLLRDPDKQAELDLVAARGIQSLFDAATETVTRLLTHEEAEKAGLLDGGPEHFLTPTGMGCKDCDHNPKTNGPCSDPWLACLGCSNAFAVTDHLPSLVCVYDLLEALREATEEPIWVNRYQLAWARLTVILDSLNEAQWEQARSEITPEQRAMAEAAVLTREFEI